MAKIITKADVMARTGELIKMDNKALEVEQMNMWGTIDSVVTDANRGAHIAVMAKSKAEGTDTPISLPFNDRDLKLRLEGIGVSTAGRPTRDLRRVMAKMLASNDDSAVEFFVNDDSFSAETKRQTAHMIESLAQQMRSASTREKVCDAHSVRNPISSSATQVANQTTACHSEIATACMATEGGGPLLPMQCVPAFEQCLLNSENTEACKLVSMQYKAGDLKMMREYKTAITPVVSNLQGSNVTMHKAFKDMWGVGSDLTPMDFVALVQALSFDLSSMEIIKAKYEKTNPGTNRVEVYAKEIGSRLWNSVMAPIVAMTLKPALEFDTENMQKAGILQEYTTVMSTSAEGITKAIYDLQNSTTAMTAWMDMRGIDSTNTTADNLIKMKTVLIVINCLRKSGGVAVR